MTELMSSVLKFLDSASTNMYFFYFLLEIRVYQCFSTILCVHKIFVSMYDNLKTTDWLTD